MRYLMPTLSTAALVLALSACGNDQPATQAPAGTAAPETTSAAPESAPAATPDVVESDAPVAAGADDELVYDPIDVSKLDNQWWRQYSAGG